jgi:hypothetical protein
VQARDEALAGLENVTAALLTELNNDLAEEKKQSSSRHKVGEEH